MNVAIITGSCGLIGSEAVAFLSDKVDVVVGIDNDMRSYFFGEAASVNWNRKRIQETYNNYIHSYSDIRSYDKVDDVFKRFGSNIKIVIHAAAQPSHDWAANEPLVDFAVNATGTLNMLEATRRHCPTATFIFTSTNKVYGDLPNYLPLIEMETRYDLPYSIGIDEKMSIDNSVHSVFGASKVAADVMVQEYGKYFGLNTGVFRGGCLTGPHHSGAMLHGFLSYLMKCAVTGKEYSIIGHKGKQVRDNIHAYDLVNMFWHFHCNPRPGEVYNAGGGRHSNCSVLEAISMCEELTGNKMKKYLIEEPRTGDHKWYISNISKFKKDYPHWDYKYSLPEIIKEIFIATKENTKQL